MVLSNAQKAELHKAILGYLKKNGFEEACTAFSKATSLKLGAQGDAKYDTMLEHKWRSIVKLQKKINTLETANRQLTEDLASSMTGKRTPDSSQQLPREPSKFTLVGHRSPITAVCFHPSFNLVVSASEDSSIKVWDYDSGKIERTLQSHTDAVQDVCFNPAGTLLGSCSADLSIKVWNFETFENSKTLLGHDHNVSSVRFMPSGDFIVSASRDKKIKVWEIATGYCVKTLTGHDAWVRKVEISPDGFYIGSASADQTIRTWNSKTGECVKVGRDHDHVVETLAFSNGLADQFIVKMLLEEQKSNPASAQLAGLNILATQLGLTATVPGSAPSAPGGASPPTDVKEEGKDSATTSEKPPESSAKASPGGLFLVSGSRDRTIKIWQVSNGLCVKTLSGHDNWVRHVLFHPCGRYIISCSDDKSIRVWDLQKNGRNVSKIENAHKSFVSCIDWNKGFPMLASGSMDNTVQIWPTR